MNPNSQLIKYHNTVLNPYQLYNSLFLNLPFDTVYHTGMLLPLLHQACVDGYRQSLSPQQIMERFIDQHLAGQDQQQQLSTLFRFIQYIERQIVLFDSVEEAAYTENHELDGPGTVPHLAQLASYRGQQSQLQEQLGKHTVRVVLTAHPTQFYPGAVLGIMTDLSQAIGRKDTTFIEKLLQQLGKTPLFNQQKPTPYDEAMSLIWYLEHVFYDTIQTINRRVQQAIFAGGALPEHAFIELGFWPGGDRDGNPYVTAEITAKVANKLRQAILRCYHQAVRRLKRRLTFPGVVPVIENLEQQLYHAAHLGAAEQPFDASVLLQTLKDLRQTVVAKHQSLFVDEIDALIQQVNTFGFYFATLDVRQDSRVHHQVMLSIIAETAVLDADWADLNEDQQIRQLADINTAVEPLSLQDPMAQDTLACIQTMVQVQRNNGEKGANRYIISNCQSALNVMEVLAFFTLADWPGQQVSVDIIPLFETIDDLANAPHIMSVLYQNSRYQAHLRQRQNKQTIMLGFSDGTKDGGYLAANWAIVEAKQRLSQLAGEHDIKVVFFDGRGGPPARGGGVAHKFYAAQNPNVSNQAIQLTIQGQTISSNFGNRHSAQYNLEQLLSAGLSNTLENSAGGWDKDSQQLLSAMAKDSLEHYVAFKNHPKFVPYLEKISTLKYYGKTNIGSRPTKRNPGEGLNFSDLRAIPFVGAWSQLKQNVLGYYGLGYALTRQIQMGQLTRLQQLYLDSGFFRALIDNSMMSLCKSFMPLTAYMQDDAEFGEFWLTIFAEYQAAEKALKQVADTDELLPGKPLRRQSIQAREDMVLPLLTIQQYALQRINLLRQSGQEAGELIHIYEKLVTRSLYGNINASRNSV
ncbi:phosphoenolpyruvate carboxylase [Marinicella sediminis]|uniref:Phosphoenolpyruvate carboxylase n=1 Tax=Marinicella sediminis TaxID=1792834 RepID=A0ABV7JAK5_9GAMM|nr:phosphoenolpyruvate carboxylase [Marinicella sediminis]